MGDTFQPDFSDTFEEEEEKVVATLTMWPTSGSVPFEARVLCFDKGPFVVGRSDSLPEASDNANFKFPNVSRIHASLSFDTGSFWVADKGSSFGTFVNNIKVGKLPTKLNHGDILQLGTNTSDIKCVMALIHLYYPSLEKTISLDSLINEIEKEENRSPSMEVKLKGLKDAKKDRKLLQVSTKEAVALQPSLLEFPETQKL